MNLFDCIISTKRTVQPTQIVGFVYVILVQLLRTLKHKLLEPHIGYRMVFGYLAALSPLIDKVVQPLKQLRGVSSTILV